jgi:hypothetical protein
MKLILWKMPPKIKIYEALGAVGDGRVSIKGSVLSIKGKVERPHPRQTRLSPNPLLKGEGTTTEAWVESSSRGKKYTVLWNAENKAIMTNDNGTYWQGYLGYPAVAFLMKQGLIKYDEKIATALKNIPWKDINTKYKNNFEKTLEDIWKIVGEKGVSKNEIETEVEWILKGLEKLGLVWLGKRIKPPSGY